MNNPIDFKKHQLLINDESSQHLEMTLKNSNYSMHRNSCHRRIILLISTYLICLFAFSETPSFMVHLIFLMFLLWLSISLSSLVESETVKVISHSGIEKSVKYSFGRRQSVFIASQSIFKLVINEVIYFNQVIYVLQLLIHDQFTGKPKIIVLLDKLLPPLDCLIVVYRRMIPKLDS